MQWPSFTGQSKCALLAMLAATFLALSSPYGACETVTMLDNFKTDTGWRAVNDNVMGGRSQGRVSIGNGFLVFEGAINTNGGGFASIRRPMALGELANAKALVLRVKSDGRSYRLILQGNQQYRGFKRTKVNACIHPLAWGKLRKVCLVAHRSTSVLLVSL